MLNCNDRIKCYLKIPPTERAITESLYPKLLIYDHGSNRESPHILLNELNNGDSIVCEMTKTQVPKEYYVSLLRPSCKLLMLLMS